MNRFICLAIVLASFTGCANTSSRSPEPEQQSNENPEIQVQLSWARVYTARFIGNRITGIVQSYGGQDVYVSNEWNDTNDPPEAQLLFWSAGSQLPQMQGVLTAVGVEPRPLTFTIVSQEERRNGTVCASIQWSDLRLELPEEFDVDVTARLDGREFRFRRHFPKYSANIERCQPVELLR